MRGSARRKAAAGLTGVLALVAIYALAGFFLAPYLAKRELARYAQSLERHAEAAEVRFNPFTYTLEAKGISLKEQDGRPIAAIARLYADFDFVSIVQGAWSFSELAIEGADIAVEIDRDGKLNLARLAQRLARPDRQPASEPPPAIMVRDLRIDRATVRYADHSRSQPVRATAGPLSVQVTDLSTVAGREGRYTLTAGLPDGASLTGKGMLSLRPLASAGDMRLAEFSFATAWPFLQHRLRIAQPRGTATLQAAYQYRHIEGKQPAVRVSGADVQLKSVYLSAPDADLPLLELASAHAKQARYDSATGALTVPSIELANGRYTAIVDADGRFNWSELAVPGDEQKAAGRWSARVDAVKLTDIAVRYEDHTRRTPLRLDIGKGNAAFRLALASGADATRTTAEDMRLDLQQLSLTQAGAQEALVVLAAASIEGGRIDTQERIIAVGNALLTGGRAALVRDAQRNIPMLQAFQRAIPPEPASGPRWRYRVDAATLQNTQLAVGDGSFDPALRYDFEVAKLVVQAIDADSDTPIAFETDIKAAQGGTLTATGTASQDFGRASAKIEVSALSVLPAQALLAKYATLDMRSGRASATAAVEYAQGAKPMLRVVGAMKVADMAIDDSRTRQRFLSWKLLAADNVALTLGPDRLDIKELLLDQLETAILISKDRKVNLAEVVKTADTAPADAAARAPQENAASDDPAAFPVRVGRLRLQSGSLDFADASLVLPFSTRVTRLNGTVVGLATDPQSRAELKLGGRIEPSGYASAEGGVNLRHPTAFMDINVKFQNVEMQPLSPYTATFAGRKIDSGRVWLDLDYKIANKQLAGANRVLLENVVLGERVQAPNALDLPLDLAIALLKDSQGRINMTVPVTGDIGNPRFNYGTLIRDAVASAIGRIVTAPFRALASLFGGNSGEELGKVRFSAGSARLYPPERESLQKVAKALQERPQLKVIVRGPYDAQRDAERLRRDPVRRDLAQAMGQKLQPGEDPGPIPYSDPETQRAIEKLYLARAGLDGLRELAARYAKEHGKDPSAQDPDRRRAYYEHMFGRLVESYPLPDTALQQLAGERAQAVAGALAAAGVDRSRIEIGPLRAVTDSAEPTIDAELELAVGDKAA